MVSLIYWKKWKTILYMHIFFLMVKLIYGYSRCLIYLRSTINQPTRSMRKMYLKNCWICCIYRSAHSTVVEGDVSRQSYRSIFSGRLFYKEGYFPSAKKSDGRGSSNAQFYRILMPPFNSNTKNNNWLA